MREDRYTNTIEDAARYEQDRGRDDDAYDEGPSRGDLAEDRPGPPRPETVVCKARTHNPTPAGTPNAPYCYHCPDCGSSVQYFTFDGDYKFCSNQLGCGWSHGTPSLPPF